MTSAVDEEVSGLPGASGTEEPGAVEWRKAAEEKDLWEGDILDVEVDNEEILLVWVPGEEIRAYQGLCPHQEVLLGDGHWDESSGRLVCSGHAWEFDLRRGEGINPKGCKLFQFGVRVRDGNIEVAIPQDGKRHYNRCVG